MPCMTIKERARQIAESLPTGRISAADLQALYRAAHPSDDTPANVVSLAFQAAGLLSRRTARERYYERPDALPLEPVVATVDLSHLGLRPGDPYQVFYGPGEITITPAIVAIKLRKPPA